MVDWCLQTAKWLDQGQKILGPRVAWLSDQILTFHSIFV